MPANTRRRTIATNRRSSMAGPLTDSSNNNIDHDGINVPIKTRSSKQRMSMIPRMSGSSSSDLKPTTTSSGRKSTSRHSLTPGKVMSKSTTGRKSISSIHYSPHHSQQQSSTAVSSRQSIGSSIPPPTTSRVDNRPISDKAYFNTCVKNLYSYLTANQYEHPIKLKDLSRPSGKDFHNIMVFLLTKCDPTFEGRHYNGNKGNTSTAASAGTKHKFEDDVAMMFKTLGYPFNISKTALVAAGSPHTWPTLLLAITWLIELLNCMSDESLFDDDIGHLGYGDDIVDDANDIFSGIGKAGQQKLDVNSTIIHDLDEMEQRNKVVMQRFVERSYESFLCGDDDLHDKMENDLIEYVDKDHMVIEEAIERTVNENKMIEERIMFVEEEAEDLPARQQRLEKLAVNLEEFHALVDTLNNHKNELAAKVQEREADLEIKTAEIERMEKHIEDLIATISNQEYSIEDVHHLEREKAQLEESIEQMLLKRQEFETVILEGEIKLKQELERLERLIVPYNEVIDKLPMDDSLVTQIVIQKDLVDEKEQKMLLGNVDLKEKLIPVLSTMETKYIEDSQMLKSQLYELMQRDEEMNQKVKDGEEKIEGLTEANRRAEEIYEDDKKEHDDELSSIEKEINKRKEKVETLKDPSAVEAVMSKYQAQIIDLNSLIKKHQEGNMARKQSVLNEFNHALKVCSEYKLYREEKMKSIQKYVRSRQQFDVSLSEEDMKVISS